MEATTTFQTENDLYAALTVSHPDQADVLMTVVQDLVYLESELRRAIERLRADLDDAVKALDHVYNLNPRGVVHGDGTNVDRLVALRAEKWNTLVLLGRVTGLDLVGEVTAILKTKVAEVLAR